MMVRPDGLEFDQNTFLHLMRDQGTMHENWATRLELVTLGPPGSHFVGLIWRREHPRPKYWKSVTFRRHYWLIVEEALRHAYRTTKMPEPA
jgi:hypothetical protein